ncbi:hypothetical protein ACFQ1Q_04865 [Winogradskyella litorisediminis]|uniref:O-antigen ligase-like membrane protein n=1 Tax=Winogradskyella litorisediminis TaxID=1156618 RepID=A0ABW3N4P1_9FLAO
MSKTILSKFDEFLLSNFILIILASEFFTKILILSENLPYRVSTFVKLGLGLYLFFYIYKKNLWWHKILKFLYFLTIIFIVGQLFFLFKNNTSKTDLLNNLFTFSTYIFLPLFVVCVENEKTHEIVLRNVISIKVAAFINLPIILFSLIVPFEIFRSYPLTDRFGFNGFLGFSSSASFFYIAIIIIFFGTYYINKSKKNLIFLILHTFISILVGTKTIWFFLLLVAISYFCFLIKNPLKSFFRFLFLIGIIFFLSFREKIELFIVSIFSFAERYYNEYGFLTVILSTRDLYFKQVYNYYISNFSLPTFLFGGINVIKIRVEFEFINMFVFFGLFGTLVYLLIIRYIFYKTQQKPIKTTIFVALIITCALSGGFFYSVFSACLFYLAYRYLDYIKQE